LPYIWAIEYSEIRSRPLKTISISNDIVPIAEFKTGISKWFKYIQEAGHPLIITQNGKPAGVLLSPGDYDELVHNKVRAKKAAAR
jgi:antitoxin YefM